MCSKLYISKYNFEQILHLKYQDENMYNSIQYHSKKVVLLLLLEEFTALSLLLDFKALALLLGFTAILKHYQYKKKITLLSLLLWY